jgi:hypothetical protein
MKPRLLSGVPNVSGTFRALPVSLAQASRPDHGGIGEAVVQSASVAIEDDGGKQQGQQGGTQHRPAGVDGDGVVDADEA